MTSDYRQITFDINAKLKEMRSEVPESMQGFQKMAQAIHSDGALSAKTKELIATALGVAARCQGCLGFHAQACVRMGVTRPEFEEMLQVAMYMGGGPSVMTAAEALQAYEEFGGEKAEKVV